MKPIPVVPIPGDPIADPRGSGRLAPYLIGPSPNDIPPVGLPVELPNDPTVAPKIPPMTPEASERRKQVFKQLPTRKRTLDAKPRPRPQKSGEKRVTRQGKNKSGMGTKSEKHKKGGRHFHDDRHNDKKKPNVHYGFPGV